MEQVTFSSKGSKPNVDRENSRLNNCVVMTTDFNLNNNAVFGKVNQEEIVLLGSSEKTYCYLGHPKKGATSDDRLPFRLGYFENFCIDGSAVKADLVLSPTIDTNPVLLARFPNGIKEYIFSLAEKEADECGFSMSVGMAYNENDTVTILRLSSIDLVEDPALTVAMFSEDKLIEDVHPSLNFAFDQFNALDTAIKTGTPIEAVLAALLSSLATLQASPAVEVDEETPNEEAPLEPTQEAPAEEVQEEEQIASIQTQIDSLKNDIADIKAAVMSFSKQEIIEEPKKEQVVVQVVGHIAEETVPFSKQEHIAEFRALRAAGKTIEAARYFERYLG